MAAGVSAEPTRLDHPTVEYCLVEDDRDLALLMSACRVERGYVFSVLLLVVDRECVRHGSDSSRRVKLRNFIFIDVMVAKVEGICPRKKLQSQKRSEKRRKEEGRREGRRATREDGRSAREASALKHTCRMHFKAISGHYHIM